MSSVGAPEDVARLDTQSVVSSVSEAVAGPPGHTMSGSPEFTARVGLSGVLQGRDVGAERAYADRPLPPIRRSSSGPHSGRTQTFEAGQ